MISKLLNHAAVNISSHLSVLLTRLYDTGAFPSEWCKRMVVPVPQKGMQTTLQRSGPYKRSDHSEHTHFR